MHSLLLTALLSASTWLLQDDEAARQESRDRLREGLAAAATAEAEGRFEDAQSQLYELRDHAYDHELPTGEINHALGRVLYALGRAEDAISVLYDAQAQLPEDLDVALLLMDLLVEHRDFALANGEPYVADAKLQQARDVLDPLVERFEGEPAFTLRRARILARTREHEAEAVPLFMDLLRASPNEQSLHGEFVKAVGAAGLFERALGFYEGLDMERALRLWYLGEVHVARAHFNFNRFQDDQQALDDYHAAERLILEAGRVNPEWADSASQNAAFHRAWAGWVFIRADQRAQAWEHFRSSLGRLPGCQSAIDGLNYLASKFMEDQDLDTAREVSRELCLHAPDNADFWNNYGLLCRDTELYEEAFLAYRRAMALNPQDPRVINDAAMMLQYYLHRDLDLAERWLLQARDIAKGNWQNAGDEAFANDQLLVYGDSLVNLWRLYDDQGRMEEASAMRAEMREADPHRPELPPLPRDDDGGDGEGDGEGEGA